MTTNPDHYKILGLDSSASADEIKKAYRKLSKKFHPDKNEGDAFFENMFKQIQNAYEIIGDEEKRHYYDMQMGFKPRQQYRSQTEQPQAQPRKKRKPISADHWMEPKQGIDNLVFFQRMIFLIAGMAVCWYMGRMGNQVVALLGNLGGVALLFVAVVQTMKRLTHLRMSWWYLLIILVPFVNWIFLIYLCFAKPKNTS